METKREDWITKCKWGLPIQKDIIEKYDLTKDFSFKNYIDNCDVLFVTIKTKQLNTRAEMSDFMQSAFSNMNVRFS